MIAGVGQAGLPKKRSCQCRRCAISLSAGSHMLACESPNSTTLVELAGSPNTQASMRSAAGPASHLSLSKPRSCPTAASDGVRSAGTDRIAGARRTAPSTCVSGIGGAALGRGSGTGSALQAVSSRLSGGSTRRSRARNEWLDMRA